MDGADRLSFLGGGPADFRLHTLVLQPGDAIDYAAADWADTLVVVERGALDVECRSGAQARFQTGAVLTFTGVPVRRLGNSGTVPVVLSALSRVRPTGSPA